jgi:hypothetical protein
MIPAETTDRCRKTQRDTERSLLKLWTGTEKTQRLRGHGAGLITYWNSEDKYKNE